MRALIALLLLPLRRHVVGMSATMLILATAATLLVLLPGGSGALPALALYGVGVFLMAILSGSALLSVARPETQLMPNFVPALRSVVAIYAVFGAILPALWILGFTQQAWIVLSMLLLAYSLGIASGSGSRIGLALWLVAVTAGLRPQATAAVLRSLNESPYTAVAVLLAAALLLRDTLKRLLRIDDRAPTVAPMDVSAHDRHVGMDALRNPRLGKVARWLMQRHEAFANMSLSATVQALARAPDAEVRRRAALRRLLLPNDNWRSFLLQALSACALFTLIIYFMSRRDSGVSASFGTYVLMLIAMRFAALHRGYLLMRSSLCDTYLTLAPTSVRDFHGAIADAYAGHIWTSIALASVLLIAMSPWLPASERPGFVIGGIVAVTALTLCGYALFLMLTDATKPRALLITTLMMLLAILAGVYVLDAARRGHWMAAAAAGTVGMAFAGSLLGFARREIATRRPVFDPPL